MSERAERVEEIRREEEKMPSRLPEAAKIQALLAEIDRLRDHLVAKEESLTEAVDYYEELEREIDRLREERERLRKIIEDAGIVTGEDAKKILHEMKHGTPDTPKRRATIERADRARRALTDSEDQL